MEFMGNLRNIAIFTIGIIQSRAEEILAFTLRREVDVDHPIMATIWRIGEL